MDKMKMKQHAKLKLLEELSDKMSEGIGGDLAGQMGDMKKVTVAAPDEEGLEEGLDKAKEILPEVDAMAEDIEGEEMEDEFEDEMSKEELMAQLEEIKAKLEMMD